MSGWHTDAVRNLRSRYAAWVAVVLAALLAVTACSGSTATLDDAATSANDEGQVETGPDADSPQPDSSEPDQADPPPSLADPEPVPYRPAGAIGSADAYNALIAEIEAELPADIRRAVPWPDLRNPDPGQVQVEIFDLWIWVIENHPDPAFARAMTAPGSPSREETTGVFGRIQADNELHLREGSPYVAFDHRVVTFESAGLPLWLGRDVPSDAVVVYYQDQSGPTTIRDRDSGEILGGYGGPGARQWLSIMVPTEAGWMLFRDQLIEPGDSELEVPALPSPDTVDPRTDV